MSYWYCPNCKIELDGCHVTYEEKCEYCGSDVLFVPETISQTEIDELLQAKAEGRLVVLPCKVGSDLWSIERARTKCTAHGEEYSEYSCQGCEEPCDSVITQKIRRVKEASHMTIAHFMQSDCFGKTVFLTREEAEKALGGGEG